MDDLATMARVTAETNRVVGAIGADQYGLPTLCTDWTVHDLVNHVTGGGRMFAAALRDGRVGDDLLVELMTVDQLGDDAPAAFGAACGEAFAAFDALDDLDVPVALPFGTMPASVALQLAIFDLTTHAVDLARATGQDLDGLDVDVLASALASGQLVLDDSMRGPNFAPAVAVPDGAPLADQLSAFAGRAI